MRKQFPLFIGYFKRDVNRSSLVGFLLDSCPDLGFIDLYKCEENNVGKCYCCKLTFDSKGSMERASKVLAKRKIKGRSIVIRDWTARTAANERRDVIGESSLVPIPKTIGRETVDVTKDRKPCT